VAANAAAVAEAAKDGENMSNQKLEEALSKQPATFVESSKF